MEEKPVCQVTHIKPTVENAIPYNRYNRTQPLINGIPMINVPSNDMLILFGGGRDWVLRILQDPTNAIQGVEVFVMNSAIELWFDNLNYGLEVPYDSVIYHGSINNDDKEGHQLSMILTLERDPLLNKFFPPIPQQLRPGVNPPCESIEITLKPKYSLYDRHYNAEIDTLFNFEDFGVNRGDEMVNNCNEAIATCLEIYNAELEPEPEPEPELEPEDDEQQYMGFNETFDMIAEI